MRRFRHSGWGLLLVALALPAAAPQVITRWSVDGGGGRSQGGQYVLTGSIGQPDAKPLMQGGQYRIGAGFWTAVPDDALFRDGFEGD